MCSEGKELQKQEAAKAACAFIKDGMIIGMGTGSTVYYLIREMGRLLQSGMKLKAVVTSERSRELAETYGIPVLLPEEAERIDLAIDGVDEIDSGFCAVKGGGGALTREKIVAVKADEVIWIMDESKLVRHLGHFPLPVEVIPFGHTWAEAEIRRQGGRPVLRKKDGQIFRTDNGNYIFDVTFEEDTEYREAAAGIRQIPGVVETGFFDSICSRILVGTDAGVKEIRNLETYVTDGYIGTYYSEKSRGIYHLTFDERTGQMTEPELFYEAPNAKWVFLDGDLMVLPVERQGRAGACFLEIEDGKVVREQEILEEKQTPCYILQEGGYVYTANYHEGNVMVYRLENGTPSLVKRIENGARAGCHQILLHGDQLMVPCLEQNRIRLFDIGRGFEPAGEILFPEGSGPRHGVFNGEHTRFYVVSEWSNELFVFNVKDGKFTPAGSMSVLPQSGREDYRDAASAAIRLTRDERFLYVSVRGADILAVFEIEGDRVELIQHTPCGGAHPRDMVLSADERYLLVANRFEGGIVSMERDPESGLLGAIRHRVSMPEGVALAFTKKDRR